MKRVYEKNYITAVECCYPRSSIHRGNNGPLCWQRGHLEACQVWSSQESCFWRLTWYIFHQLLYPWTIPIQAKNRQMAFSSSDNYINATNSQFQSRQKQTGWCTYYSWHWHPTKENYLCSVVHQVMRPAYLQAAVLVSRCRVGFMTIEIHRNVVGRRCSITARGLMDILPGRPFFVHIANLTAKPLS